MGNTNRMLLLGYVVLIRHKLQKARYVQEDKNISKY